MAVFRSSLCVYCSRAKPEKNFFFLYTESFDVNYKQKKFEFIIFLIIMPPDLTLTFIAEG